MTPEELEYYITEFKINEPELLLHAASIEKSFPQTIALMFTFYTSELESCQAIYSMYLRKFTRLGIKDTWDNYEFIKL